MTKAPVLVKGIQVQGHNILLKKLKSSDKTDGGVLLTVATQDKKSNNKPTAMVIQFGERLTNDDIDIKLGTAVLFDPMKAKAVFEYKNDMYIVATADSILMTVDDPNSIS